MRRETLKKFAVPCTRLKRPCVDKHRPPMRSKSPMHQRPSCQPMRQPTCQSVLLLEMLKPLNQAAPLLMPKLTHPAANKRLRKNLRKSRLQWWRHLNPCAPWWPCAVTIAQGKRKQRLHPWGGAAKWAIVAIHVMPVQTVQALVGAAQTAVTEVVTEAQNALTAALGWARPHFGLNATRWSMPKWPCANWRHKPTASH